MSDRTCETVKPHLPEWARGTAQAAEARHVAEHLASCSDCAGEARVIGALLAARPSLPEGLGDRLQAAVRAERVALRSGRRGNDTGAVKPPAGGRKPTPVVGGRRSRGVAGRRLWLRLAAGVVLALGTAVVWRGVGGGPTAGDDALVLAAAAAPDSRLVLEDAIVAGAPVLDDLSDEMLTALLEEMAR